jgi:hypothetical protein
METTLLEEPRPWAGILIAAAVAAELAGMVYVLFSVSQL